MHYNLGSDSWICKLIIIWLKSWYYVNCEYSYMCIPTTTSLNCGNRIVKSVLRYRKKKTHANLYDRKPCIGKVLLQSSVRNKKNGENTWKLWYNFTKSTFVPIAKTWHHNFVEQSVIDVRQENRQNHVTRRLRTARRRLREKFSCWELYDARNVNDQYNESRYIHSWLNIKEHAFQVLLRLLGSH